MACVPENRNRYFVLLVGKLSIPAAQRNTCLKGAEPLTKGRPKREGGLLV